MKDGERLERIAVHARHREVVQATDRWVAKRARIDDLKVKSRTKRDQVVQNKARIRQLKANIEQFETYKKTEEGELGRLTGILANSTETVQIDLFEKENLTIDRELQEARRPLQSLERGLSALGAMRPLPGDGWSDKNFTALQTSLRTLLASDPIGTAWPRNGAGLTQWLRSLPPLDKYETALHTREQQTASTLQTFKERLKEAEERLSAIESGGRALSRRTTNFIEALEADGINARVFAEMVHVKASFESWRPITENILGAWCEAVIVDPVHYRQAVGLLRRGRGQGFAGCRLIQTTRTGDINEHLQADSLAATLETENSMPSSATATALTR